MAEAAGLVDVQVIARSEYAKAIEDFDDPIYRTISDSQRDGFVLCEYITSADITARKPA